MGQEKEPESLPATFDQLLPDNFQTRATAPMIREEIQNLLQDRPNISFSQGLDRVRRIEEIARVDTRLEKSLSLVQNTSKLSLFKYDPLEQFRIARGLAKKRENLAQKLKNSMSFDRGLFLFNLIKGRPEAYADTNDINSDFPHITKAEIILFSLLNNAPSTFVQIGRKEGRPQQLLVPVVAGSSTEGLFISDDCWNPNQISTSDAYGNLGLTGVSESVEFSPFTSTTREDFEELVSLSISNYRLHQRLKEGSLNCLLDGIGKLDRAADALNKTQSEIDRIFGSNIVADLHTGQILETQELVELVGLLGKIPLILLDENSPFYGYFIPYGPGVIFIDNQQVPKSYMPYHPHYIRESLQGLYYESKTTEKSNRSTALIYNDLVKHVDEGIQKEIETTGEETSILEGLRADFELVLGIKLEILPLMQITPIDRDGVLSNFLGATSLEPILKFGADEARHVFETLKILPRELLKDIGSVRKVLKKDVILEELLSGLGILAEYDKITHTISVYQNPALTFSKFTPELLALRSFIIVHEIAHSIWEKLDAPVQEAWTNVSWNRKIVQKEDYFLTLYSYVKNPEEDFCDHFASYVLHAGEFRQRTGKSLPLREKYNLIKNYLVNILGRDLEYPQVSPFEIEILRGRIDAQLQKLTEEEVADILDQKQKTQEYESIASTEKVVVRPDQEDLEDIVTPRPGILRAEMLEMESRQINTLLDFFAPYMRERAATRLAQDIYQLLEDYNTREALSLASQFFDEYGEDDEDLWKELQETIIDIGKNIFK